MSHGIPVPSVDGCAWRPSSSLFLFFSLSFLPASLYSFPASPTIISGFFIPSTATHRLPAAMATTTETQMKEYFLEQNPTEVERLSYQHEVIKDFAGTLLFVPTELSKPGLRILDSATADGVLYRPTQTVHHLSPPLILPPFLAKTLSFPSPPHKLTPGLLSRFPGSTFPFFMLFFPFLVTSQSILTSTHSRSLAPRPPVHPPARQHLRRHRYRRQLLSIPPSALHNSNRTVHYPAMARDLQPQFRPRASAPCPPRRRHLPPPRRRGHAD